METKMNQNNSNINDGVDRRRLLKCMAWVGTAVLWTMRDGILSSQVFGADQPADPRADFSFIQISDSHIGFSKEPNKDVTGTLKLAIERMNALKTPGDLLIHTGDLT